MSPRVWITGASSGIGAALAEELHARGARVAISARRTDQLAKVSAGRMLVQPVDVMDRIAVLTAAEKVVDAFGGIDVAVLNAGAWDRFDVLNWDPDSFRNQFEVNVFGMSYGIEAVLPSMLERGRGTIVGVASVAGYRGMPGGEAYSATKAAQINLLESLRGGLRHKGIRVQTVCPGFVRTPMTARNTFPMPFMVEPGYAARKIADGIVSGKPEIVFPRRMAVLMKAARLVPVGLWSRFAGRRR
ncbi:SDR family NAD(P)-dependent oxidoreductase [Allokutzneria multivorans]|uniref:SDR family NAD(P)-dependent oxidoreductase n=1 Tax=Allokutzneria multivorans TaxID=1142134 RepID=A0ABP7S1G5_9PSEU